MPAYGGGPAEPHEKEPHPGQPSPARIPCYHQILVGYGRCGFGLAGRGPFQKVPIFDVILSQCHRILVNPYLITLYRIDIEYFFVTNVTILVGEHSLSIYILKN